MTNFRLYEKNKIVIITTKLQMAEQATDQESRHKKRMWDMEVLRVPHDSQPEAEPECMVYSLYYISEYINNRYPRDAVNEIAEELSIDDIRELLNVSSETGWTLNESELNRVSDELEVVSFEINNSGITTGFDDFYEIIQSNLNQNKPVIIILDDIPFRPSSDDQIGGEGPRHAVVAVGMNESDITIHDPWNGSFAMFPKENIAKSWELGGKLTIEVEIKNQSGLQDALRQGETNE